MFGEFLSACFSGLWDAILAKFGMSPQERLGKEETIAKNEAQTLKEVQNAENLATKYDGLSDSALRLLAGQWERK